MYVCKTYYATQALARICTNTMSFSKIVVTYYIGTLPLCRSLGLTLHGDFFVLLKFECCGPKHQLLLNFQFR